MIEIRYIYDWDNKPVNEYTINNGKYKLSAINIGAAITKIIVPNKNDKLENITLRYHDYKDYRNNNYLLGTLIDYKKFISNENSQLNHYFNCKLEENTIVFKYDENDKYIEVKYSLLDNNFLIEYDTNMDIMLSNSLFFNLTGNIKGNILDHELLIGNRLIELDQYIDKFEHYKVNNESELITIRLKDSGIKITIDANERNLSLSNGKYFNKLFNIKKDIQADIYKGLGIVIGGNNFNKFVNYNFGIRNNKNRT